MIPADLKDILGDTYNDYFFNNGSNYSKILENEGILIFNSFINRKGLINLQKEAADLKHLSYQVPLNIMYMFQNMIILFLMIVLEIEL